MTLFHASVRDLLEDVHLFLVSTLKTDVLSSASITHRERLLIQLSNLGKDYPELQLKFPSAAQNLNETLRYSPTSPVPYVDMNAGSPYKFPQFASNGTTEETSYDICLTKEKSESRSIAESDDYNSDDAKNRPYVSAVELASCGKSGYLDKKKRDSLKGWLNPYQRRWCAIKDSVFYYYEKNTDRKQRGSISLNGYEARSVLEENDGKKYNHCFELVCPGKRTYQFSAPTENDMQQWISAIGKCTKVYSGKSTISPQKTSLTIAAAIKKCDLIDECDDIYETVLEETEIAQPKELNTSIENEEYSDVDTVTAQNETLNYSEWYVGLWDCTSSDDTELSFVRGDLIRVVSKEYDSYAWWVGELNGKTGFVPKSYLMEAYEAY